MKYTANNKRITKNTIVLYVRMFFTMGISLYTSRIVLNTLGVTDFGIYSVVNGIVVILSFLNTAISSATQRYISFALGLDDHHELKKVFSMTVNIHVIISVAIFILAETLGLWFLQTKLVIPVERMEAAKWVYHFSILTFVVIVLSVPYNATIIAHERMKVYAVISIVESVLKLLIVFALVLFGVDKLKMYAVLVLFVSVILFVIYIAYCRLHFMETIYIFSWDKSLFKTLMNFASWNMFGHFAWMIMGHGLNILLNIFVGPLLNAAWSIAFQLNNAVSILTNNIRMAVNPQIVKSYANKDIDYMNTLVFESAKYSFFLLLLFTLPILLETNIILRIWLKIVPSYAVLFCQLVLLNTLIQCFDASFGMIFQAMGRIQANQLFSGGTYLMVLPTSYIFLKLGHPPQTAFYVQIVATIIVTFLIKPVLLNKLADMHIADFFKHLFSPVLKVTSIAIIIPILIRINMTDSIWRLIIVGLISFISVSISVLFLGMNKQTRSKILEMKLCQSS